MEGVGQNLQDHASVYSLSWAVNKNTALTTTDLVNPFEFLRYLAKRTGMFQLIVLSPVLLLLETKISK